MNWKQITELYNREYEKDLFPYFYDEVKKVSNQAQDLGLKGHTSHSSLIIYKEDLEDEIVIFIQPIINGKVAYGYIEDRPISHPAQDAKNVCEHTELEEKIKSYLIEVSKQKNK